MQVKIEIVLENGDTLADALKSLAYQPAGVPCGGHTVHVDAQKPVALVRKAPTQADKTAAEKQIAEAFQADDEEQPLNIDPAAAFGASAAPLPGAPSTAAVSPSPIVPVALSGSAPTQPTASQQLAPTGAATESAPPASATPTASPAGVELDSEGLPWDARIHASTKTRTKGGAGTWTARRGVNDEAFVKQVEAELRALVAMPQPSAPTLPAVAEAPQQAAHPLVPLGALPQTLAPLPAAAPALAPLPQATAAPAGPTEFDDLMGRIGAQRTAGLIPDSALDAACRARNLPGPIHLFQHPEHIPQIWADLQAAYPSLV